jgi:hypothetical protein
LTTIRCRQSNSSGGTYSELQEHEAMNVRFGAGLSRRTLLHLSVSAAVLIPASRAFSLTPRAPSAPLAPDRRGQVFDDGWSFLLGDGADLAKSAYDDTAWRRIDLPHDWSIEDRPHSDPALNAVLRSVDTAPLWQKVPSREVPRLIGPFDAGLNDNMGYARSASGGPTGFTVGGVGWYRKRFKLPPLAPDARVQIIFDGVHVAERIFDQLVLFDPCIGSGEIEPHAAVLGFHPRRECSAFAQVHARVRRVPIVGSGVPLFDVFRRSVGAPDLFDGRRDDLFGGDCLSGHDPYSSSVAGGEAALARATIR